MTSRIPIRDVSSESRFAPTDLRVGQVVHLEGVVELPLVGDIRWVGVHFTHHLGSLSSGGAVPHLLTGQADWRV